MELPQFTDIVPDDENTMYDESRAGASSGATTDETVAGKTYSSNMTEAGLSIALSTGKKLTPYIDIAYVNEDTTAAAYLTERTTDGTTVLT